MCTAYTARGGVEPATQSSLGLSGTTEGDPGKVHSTSSACLSVTGKCCVYVWKTSAIWGASYQVPGNSNCDKDCLTRIGKAASVFGRLKAVWKNKYISFPVKVKLYESLVMSTLLHSAELWPLTVTHKEEEIGSCTPQVSTTITGNHMAGQNTQ